MDKWIKDALKKAEMDLIAETTPRSNDRRYLRWILTVVREELETAYDKQGKPKTEGR